MWAVVPSGLPDLLRNHVGYLAVRLGQDARTRFESAIGAIGLRAPLFDYLVALDERGPCAQRVIAASLGIDAARVVALTDELSARALVTRSVDRADRRRNVLALTATGAALLCHARATAARVEGELLSGLAPSEQAGLRALLRRALGIGL